MNLLIVGINHNSAPVELRERVAFTPEQLLDALTDLSKTASLPEVAILSTCNRTEVIAISSGTDEKPIIDWLATYHRIPVADLESSIYSSVNRDAALHAIRVACGLDSMVIGEPQILGQFKECFEHARTIGTLGTELNHLSQTSFRIAKRVRTETTIGESSTSIASTAVTLAGQLFTDLSNCNILLIGAGDTIELVGKHVQAAGMTQITIANRTLENARRLAEMLGGDAIDLQTIPQKLPQADIVIASTSAQLPILGKGTVERAIKSRKHKPILMVDLAVPRDIEPEIADLKDVYLYSVDDLQEIIQTNLSSRLEAAKDAELIIATEVEQYRSRQQSQTSNETLIRFREHHESISQQELDKAITRLSRGEDAEQVMRQFANQLTSKLMHTPTTQIKSNDADTQLLDALATIYQLDIDNE